MNSNNDYPLDSDFITLKLIHFTFKDISNVVNAFYNDVANDPILSTPFQSVSDWPHHIDRLIHFWWTRFGGRAYLDASYDPIGKHFEAGFNQHFLECWLALFDQTLQRELTTPQAEIWNAIAANMGSALARNNEIIKQHYKT